MRHRNLSPSVKSYHFLQTHAFLQGKVLLGSSTIQIAWATPARTSCAGTCGEGCAPASFPTKPSLSLQPGRVAGCLQRNSQVIAGPEQNSLMPGRQSAQVDGHPIFLSFPHIFLDFLVRESKPYILKTIRFCTSRGRNCLFNRRVISSQPDVTS